MMKRDVGIKWGVAVTGLLACSGVQANPVGPAVVNGQASFSTQGNAFSITNSPGAIINWQSFSIGAGEATRFIQQSSLSSVLNRVTGGDPSRILGLLQSNGRVFLINPNGITFGAGSVIDVAGLVASTLNLSNADFLAGRHNFTATPGAGAIRNLGSITTPAGGMVYLVASDIKNDGIITTPQGAILLAAGKSVNLVDSANPSVQVEVTASGNQALNLGSLIAKSGKVGILAAGIHNGGSINADSAVAGENGAIMLKSTRDITLDAGSSLKASGLQGGSISVESQGATSVSGTILATASQGSGGKVTMLGRQVGLDGAQIDASGRDGGGTVLVGGDAHGANPDVTNARNAFMSASSTIKADAVLNGNGGKVVVWADNATRAFGSIDARGGANGGNGGFIETSAHYLDVTGISVNAQAPKGMAGGWLLDPINVTIAAIPAADLGGALAGGNWTPNATGSTITNTTIQNALNAGTSVTINTTGALTEAGDITVNAAISKTAGVAATLTLNAGNNIALNQPIVSTANALGLVLNHGAAGSASLSNSLFLAGGNVDVQRAGVTGTGTLNVTAGATTLTGALTAGALNVSGTATALNLNGATAVSNLSVASGGTLNINGATASSVTNFSANGGTLGGTGAVNIGTFTSGAYVSYLTGAGVKTVTGALTFQPGLNGSSSLYLNGATLNTQGAVTQTGGGTVAVMLGNGSTLNNTGAWTMDGFSVLDNGGLPWQVNTFNNTGAVSVSGAGGTIGASFNSSGAINLGAGLTLWGGANTTSTVSGIVNGTGALTFSGGTNTLTAAATSTLSPSALSVTGGTSTVTLPAALAWSPATVNVTGGSLNLGATPVTTPSWTQSGGSFTNSGNVTVPAGGAFNWSGGTLNGAGTFTLSSGSTGTLLYSLNLNRPFANAGTLSQGAGWTYLYIGKGGNFNNTGTQNLGKGASGGYVYAYDTGIFGNTGILNSVGTGTNVVDASQQYVYPAGLPSYLGAAGTIGNSGTVNVAAGSTLNWNNGQSAVNTGSFTTAAGVAAVAGPPAVPAVAAGVLNFGAGSGAPAAAVATYSGTITDNGAVSFTGGTNSFTGAYNGAGALTFSGGTNSINAASTTIANLSLSGGTLQGSGNITVPTGGAFNWTGGTLAGSGTFTLSSGATGTLLYSYGSLYLNRPFANAGTLSQGAGWTYLYIGKGGNLSNSGTLNLGNGTSGGYVYAYDTGIFGNTGILNSVGTGTNVVDASQQYVYPAGLPS
ncbi:MAG: filamentous hemagglutinin N-terminal domain-containing protein, partial [Burkholderiales bacterium]|nr:filamentous hemagglutinin N-terminal domain-containing protein [Burkholderiales bacterium]